jgi:hypothetical protein
MNRVILAILFIAAFAGCKNNNNQEKRIPVAKAGDETLYYDEIPDQITEYITNSDSSVIIRNYINKWAKRELMFQQAMANLSPALKSEIDKQIEETRLNLVVYEYQRMMMLQKMDTIISEEELRNYYIKNDKSFMLTSNIVRALFIKLPAETPDLNRIRILARSNKQKDLQELESLCFQFAEKFDDFNEEWITMDRLLFEMKTEINNEENFLKWNRYYETSDSSSVRLVTINDYKIRGTLSPFEYVREDIKRIIWNKRRIKFIQELENGIYNEALKENGFKIY